MTATGFAELVAATNYSFLRGASHPAEMVLQAVALGLAGIGIADRNSVAGVVRAWAALRDAREDGTVQASFRLVTGARLVFCDGTSDIVAYPATRRGWGRLTRLLTVGNMRAVKGGCILNFDDLTDYLEDLLLIVLPHSNADRVEPHKAPPDYLFADTQPLSQASHLQLVPPSPPADLAETLSRLTKVAPGRVWLGVSMGRT
ncbi:MAG: PHP domain-containing protein, partial [Sphingorhabdus sp.]